MTRFIQQSACEGRRPHGVVPDRLRSRPRLLSRLLEDRGALRLVVAPPGFGKATLAFEYASVMFQFEHVFWLRGSSPCFLRDLDAGVLAEAVLEADEHAALMVVAAQAITACLQQPEPCGSPCPAAPASAAETD